MNKKPIKQATNPYAGNKAGMHKAPVNPSAGDKKSSHVIDGRGKDLRAGKGSK